MSVFTICRGLPGSGKTYYARGAMKPRARGSVARVNRDDFRRHIFQAEYMPGDQVFEDLVTVLQHATITAALCNGVDVICDDTNLHPEHCALLMRLAISCNAEWVIKDFTHVPLEVCIDRDFSRPRGEYVGEAIIREMFKKHSVNGWAPMPVPELTPRER